MKVEIDDAGVLRVSGESMMEKMALTAWHEAWKEKQAVLRVEVLTPATHAVEVDPPSRPMDLG